MSKLRQAPTATTNGHAAEAAHGQIAASRATAATAAASEVFVLAADSRERLAEAVVQLIDRVEKQPDLRLADLAYSLAKSESTTARVRLAIVAATREDLLKRLDRARTRLADPQCRHIHDVTGLYYTERPLGVEGKVAFLFPGEGAQYLGMLGDLVPRFAEVRECFDWCDEHTASHGVDRRPISRFIQLPTQLSADERTALDTELRSLDNAMLSVLAADWALNQVLEGLGVNPDVVAGHSAGELAALRSSGCFDEDDDSPITGMQRTLHEQEDASSAHAAVLLAVGMSPQAAADLLGELAREGVADIDQVHVAMENCPHQTVLVGRVEPMSAVEAALQVRKTMYERLALARPYHTPLFEPLLGPLAAMFDDVAFHVPRREVYSSTTGRPFPDDPHEIRSLAVSHWASPVRFIDAIENMYAAGIRVFVEVGPRGNLSSFVEDILRGRDFLAVPADVQRRPGVVQLNHLVAQLFVHHVPLEFDYLYRERDVRALEVFAPPTVASTIAIAEPQAGGSRATAVLSSPAPANVAARGTSSQVMLRHLALAEQFLADQQQVTEQFIARRRTGRTAGLRRRKPASVDSHNASAAPINMSSGSSTTKGPLIGDIVEHAPGERIVMRRRLDLAEDLYAEDHTVGGREVSKVDPHQHGLPVMPMTFTLEMMAEVASLLAPGQVPIAVRDVVLIRWLALDDPVSTVEVKAAIESPGDLPPGQLAVRVEVRDLGSEPSDNESKAASGEDTTEIKRGQVAAFGRVVLAAQYPTPPAPRPAEFTEAQASRISLYELYRGLFHGPRFQGVTSLDGFGREGIKATIQVLPRDELFHSRQEPDFLLDPVTVDVAMHPAAGWHLEQPDQAGRILLPYEMGCIEFFSPPPAPGTELHVRTWIAHASARRFTHDGDVLAPDGRLWCRFTGVRCWRFYLPVGEVNFHGPKDEYFISRDWPEAAPHDATATFAEKAAGAPVCGTTGLPSSVRSSSTLLGKPAVPHGDVREWAVLLEPSDDLVQPGMLAAAARVTLSPRELAEFRRLPEEVDRVAWLFGRVAAKDAARILWRHQCGVRLYPADIELEEDAEGRFSATLRGETERPANFPFIDLACAKRGMVGVAAIDDRPGVAIARVDDDVVSTDDGPLASELRIFEAAGLDLCEAAARLDVARRALARALGASPNDDSASIEPCGYDTATGAVEFDQAGRNYKVRTAREGNLVVAATRCREATP